MESSQEKEDEVQTKCECGADRAPGRTITVTASEFDEAVESCITEDATVPPHKFAERLGVVCVPDPEPTNAERATADLETWGIRRAKALELGPWLAGQGWTKAPEGES